MNSAHLVDHQELQLSHEKLLSEVKLERFLWKESTEECESSRAANQKLTGEVVALQTEKQKFGMEVQKLGMEVQKLGIEVTALQREKLFLECEKRVLCDKVHQLESTRREVHEERSEQLSSLQALVARKEKEVDALLLECQAGKDDLRASITELDRSRCEAVQLQVENTRLKEKLSKINVSTKLALVDLRSTGRGGDRKLVDARYAIGSSDPSIIAQTHDRLHTLPVVTCSFSEHPVVAPSSSVMPRVHSLSSASNASRTNEVCFASAITINLLHHHPVSLFPSSVEGGPQGDCSSCRRPVRP